jgi:5-methylcytosine-specific restriction endonuclease McrBC GTP-binding regulatory subunit McrB
LPPNLYLLGTMNTADKSLALLDVALRRRFSFKELNPDFSICKLPDPAMQQVLEALNRRIMLVLDREHRIGHAFFMGVKTVDDFNAVFADKIVPLLQEYFYNDWDGLRGVLGEKDAGKIVGTMLPIEGVRGRNHYAWWHDLGQPTPDFLAVLRKNYGITGGAPSLPEAANTATTTEAPVPDADPTPA